MWSIPFSKQNFHVFYPCMMHQYIPLWMRFFCNVNISWLRKCVDTRKQTTTTKLSFSSNNESTLKDHMLEPYHIVWPLHPCFHMTWLTCSSMWDGAFVRRLIDYAYFPLNKWGSQSITLWYNALHFITFEFFSCIDLVHFLHIFITQSQCALSIATFICKILEYWESLLCKHDSVLVPLIIFNM